MYQNEHNTLFAGIRSGNYFNDGVKAAESTMLGVLARMVAYTGQTITYEDALNSQEVLGPSIDEYTMNMEWPMKAVARPGITKFV